MMPLIRLIAWRYLLGTRRETTISTMAIICFIGTLIGTFSLALVICVMNGFEKATYEKLQQMHAPIIISGHGKPLNAPALQKVLKKEFPAIKALTSRDSNHVIIQEDDHDINNVMAIKGVDPAHEGQVSTIEKTIIASMSGSKKLSDILQKNHILMGRKQADELGIEVGDAITLLHTHSASSGKKITLDQTQVIVGGLFRSGVEEFDTNVIVCSLSFLHRLFPDSGVTEVGIALHENANEQQTIKALRKRLKLDVYSWKTLYPALVAALKLEKYAMFFILALITLVASMSIVSLLFMQITQKRGDIAILKANGLSDSKIRNIFLLMGMSISAIAATIGLALAYLAGWLLEKYPFIELPDVYYVSHLPIKMEWGIFVLVFLVVMLLSFIATVIPVRTTRKINIARVLRYEA